MKKQIFFALAFSIASTAASAQLRWITHTGQAVIYSHTVAEDITATSNNATGLINAETGDVAISLPVQSFQFEKALMQEHFNQPNFMDSKQFPKITFKGKLTNLASINFNKEGTYTADVTGDLTIKGVTKPITEKATIIVSNGRAMVQSKLLVKDIGSYGVGKPMGSKKKNVADDIEVSFAAQYEKNNE